MRVLKRLRDDPVRVQDADRYLRRRLAAARAKRFDVVYHLLVAHEERAHPREGARPTKTTAVPSVVGVYPAANWFERETFDMYGIAFSDHPDLRRLLTDYGFSGYPLRKDFPLTGYVEVRYDDELKRVVYQPVKLVQEFRDFDFMSPWEGAPLHSSRRREGSERPEKKA